MTTPSLVEIDGGMLEGGGQILRMSLAFSALQGIPVTVHNIRAGRKNPGLRAQHLKGLEIVRDVSVGKLDGGEIGSTAITFHPGKISSGEYNADTQTAGSVGLLIQVSLPCILFSNGPTTLKLCGGTNADMAPQIDYTTETHKNPPFIVGVTSVISRPMCVEVEAEDVFRPILEKFGATFEYDIVKRGYYPRGGGEVHIRVTPVPQLKPVTLLDPGRVVRIWGWSYVAGALPIRMAHVMADAATRSLQRFFKNVEVSIERYKESPDAAVGSGSGINIVAETSTGCILGGSGLGKREVRPEEVGEKAADEIIQTVKCGACVDSYAQDQIILLMAIAQGKSQVKCGAITLHTETAIHIAQLLTQAKFKVTAKGNNSNVIECEGIGLKNAC